VTAPSAFCSSGYVNGFDDDAGRLEALSRARERLRVDQLAANQEAVGRVGFIGSISIIRTPERRRIDPRRVDEHVPGATSVAGRFQVKAPLTGTAVTV